MTSVCPFSRHTCRFVEEVGSIVFDSISPDAQPGVCRLDYLHSRHLSYRFIQYAHWLIQSPVPALALSVVDFNYHFVAAFTSDFRYVDYAVISRISSSFTTPCWVISFMNTRRSVPLISSWRAIVLVSSTLVIPSSSDSLKLVSSWRATSVILKS